MIKIGAYLMHTMTYQRPYSAQEKRDMWDYLTAIQPTTLTVIDDTDWYNEARRRLPNTFVAYRRYTQRDGYLYQEMSAQAFYDTYARYGENGGVVDCLNEPTGYGRQNTPEDLEKIADFVADVFTLFGKAGISVSAPGWGVGHPDINRLSELDVMFAALKPYHDLHFLNHHEYGTYRGMLYRGASGQNDVLPWRVGRWTFTRDYVRTKFGYTPYFWMGEHGINGSTYPGDDQHKRGYHQSGQDSLWYAEQLIDVAESVNSADECIGADIFSHGNTGRQHTAEDWATYDWSLDWHVKQRLLSYAAEKSNWIPKKLPRGATVPAPTPSPTPTPSPIDRKVLARYFDDWELALIKLDIEVESIRSNIARARTQFGLESEE